LGLAELWFHRELNVRLRLEGSQGQVPANRFRGIVGGHAAGAADGGVHHFGGVVAIGTFGTQPDSKSLAFVTRALSHPGAPLLTMRAEEASLVKSA
jgi:ketopantoate reductase